ncbi:unnamed protein product [Owenia fusiformis]|uniref:Uncharacterized protein n=1 Tax=Owenia fusiformis TaxID=6347 RepID=A0A8S4QBX7_OWEFU|nr:unnamed protein product [Owenia fusiformis]
MAVAKVFQNQLEPLMEWLDKAEKKFGSMESVSTDADKIEQQINEQKALVDGIDKHEPKFEELQSKANELLDQISDEDAAMVKDKISNLQGRFDDLREGSADRLTKMTEALH